MRGRRNGFTLIELLTVVALVGVLATLAFGAYGSATSLRNQTESAARLRQWGIALAAYVAEHNGDLPRRGQGMQKLSQLNRREDWFNALPPYFGQPGYGELVNTGRRPREGERSLFVRPGAKDPGRLVFLSYGMNMNLCPWDQPAPTRLVNIAEPSLTVFLAESPGEYASTYPSSRPFSCLAPHAGRGNVLFLDGHVASYDADYLGVGKGDPKRLDVRWLTGTASDAQASQYR